MFYIVDRSLQFLRTCWQFATNACLTIIHLLACLTIIHFLSTSVTERLGYLTRTLWRTKFDQIAPFYQQQREHFAISLRLLGGWLYHVCQLIAVCLSYVYVNLRKVMLIVQIVVPLDFLVTAWLVWIRCMPFVKIIYMLWFPYVSILTWSKTWSILADVKPAWQVLIGRQVDLDLSALKLGYGFASGLLWWKLLKAGKHSDYTSITSHSPTELFPMSIAEDYLEQFGGSVGQVTMNEEEELTEEMDLNDLDEKVDRVVSKLVLAHPKKFFNLMDFKKSSKKKAQHENCEDCEFSKAPHFDNRRYRWNQRIYGYIGNSVANIVKKIQLLREKKDRPVMYK